jgi:hypothetical protein
MKRAHFRFLTGDVCWETHGGIFYRRVGPRRYHLMRVSNWVNDVGEAEAAEVGATYHVDLSEVDLRTATEAQFIEVAGSYDCTLDDVAKMQEGHKQPDLVWVQMFREHGVRAPLWDLSGNNLRKLMQQCRAESLSLDDPEAHEKAMRRPVNRLGSTAREFAQGDITSALGRTLCEDTPTAQILAKMHRVSDNTVTAIREGQKTAITVRFHTKSIPSDDPLAFQAGYVHALAGDGLPQEDLADAYIEGYKIGVDVRCGRSPRPVFHR